MDRYGGEEGKPGAPLTQRRRPSFPWRCGGMMWDFWKKSGLGQRTLHTDRYAGAEAKPGSPPPQRRNPSFPCRCNGLWQDLWKMIGLGWGAYAWMAMQVGNKIAVAWNSCHIPRIADFVTFTSSLICEETMMYSQAFEKGRKTVYVFAFLECHLQKVR
ncbi:hypothetical protein VULLAG_LOCUS4171 [Vulpes lagopus]